MLFIKDLGDGQKIVKVFKDLGDGQKNVNVNGRRQSISDCER
jgi:hypothetical protein